MGTSQVELLVKNLPASAGDIRDSVRSLGWEDPWKTAWQPTPVSPMNRGAWGVPLMEPQELHTTEVT